MPAGLAEREIHDGHADGLVWDLPLGGARCCRVTFSELTPSDIGPLAEAVRGRGRAGV